MTKDIKMKFLRLLTPDVMDQMFNRGMYSKDNDLQNSAMLEDNIELAKKGSKSSLNILWQYVKENKISRENYDLIKIDYKNSI